MPWSSATDVQTLSLHFVLGMVGLPIVVFACSTSSQAPPARVGPPAPLVAPPRGPDDVMVASINGRPVWGSCVAVQAARGRTKDVALHECIDFELMAQAAADRGLATDPEVVGATRTALVNELVAQAYEDGFTNPADFGDKWDHLVERNLFQLKHDEYRGSTYVRVPLSDKPTPEQDAAARQLAEQIAAMVAPEQGMMSGHFVELAGRAAEGHPMVKSGTDHEPPDAVEYADVPPMLAAGLFKSYADALWAIPEVGRASHAVRTKWGWDVVLFSDVVPAVDTPPAEVATKLMPEVKRSYFMAWVNKTAKQLGLHVELDKAIVERLEDRGGP